MKPKPLIDYNNPQEIALTNQNTLRKLIGVFGMMLPLLLLVFLYVDTGYGQELESISHYYYTRVCGIFLIVVSLLAVFLMVYKGREPIDFWLSTTAGVAALLLLLFPTGNIADAAEKELVSVTTLRESVFRERFHYAAAAVFLLCLAIMSLFVFTRSSLPKHLRSPRKKLRNTIYVGCGLLMIAAMLVVLAGFVGLIPESFYDERNLTFWMETVAVESFGFAWLVKAEMFFKDKSPNAGPDNRFVDARIINPVGKLVD